MIHRRLLHATPVGILIIQRLSRVLVDGILHTMWRVALYSTRSRAMMVSSRISQMSRIQSCDLLHHQGGDFGSRSEHLDSYVDHHSMTTRSSDRSNAEDVMVNGSGNLRMRICTADDSLLQTAVGIKQLRLMMRIIHSPKPLHCMEKCLEHRFLCRMKV